MLGDDCVTHYSIIKYSKVPRSNSQAIAMVADHQCVWLRRLVLWVTDVDDVCSSSHNTMPANPPAPAHTIRTHASALTTLHFSLDNERLYTGDAGGVISIVSTRTIRPLARWKAHEDGILGVEEWEYDLAHGRKKFITCVKFVSQLRRES